MMRIVRVLLALTLCLGCAEPTTGLDGSVADGSMPDAGDAAVPDAGPQLDAALSPDAGLEDAGTDSGPSACVCGTLSECLLPSCEDGVCVPVRAPDDTACGPMGERSCRSGVCSVGSCGDGFREPGPDPAREGCDDGNTDSPGDACTAECTPEVLVVAAGGRIQPGVVSMAEDDRGELLFVWSERIGDNQPLLARPFSAAGVPRLASPIVLSPLIGRGWPTTPSVIGLASGWAVVWSERFEGRETGIWMQLVDAAGGLSARRRVDQVVVGSQIRPAIARTPTGILVAWSDRSGTMTLGGESRLRQRSFDLSGVPVSDESALSPEGRNAGDVFLASDGVTVLAVWARSSPVYVFDEGPIVMARRLGGASPDAEPFAVSEANSAQAWAAFLDTGDIAVVWVSRDDDSGGDVRTRLVHASGDPLSGTTVGMLTTGSVAEVAPRVMPLSGGNYLVTYESGVRGIITPALVGSASLAPEYPTLVGHLAGLGQSDATLLSTSRGYWFSWGTQHYMLGYGLLAYLLPPS